MSFTIKFIRCESAEEHFGNNPVPCNNGDVSVEWLRTPKVNTGNRAYQREKVASLIWKQGILHTILINVFAGIPEIHIRVIRTENGYKYELIDRISDKTHSNNISSPIRSLPFFPVC